MRIFVALVLSLTASLFVAPAAHAAQIDTFVVGADGQEVSATKAVVAISLHSEDARCELDRVVKYQFKFSAGGAYETLGQDTTRYGPAAAFIITLPDQKAVAARLLVPARKLGDGTICKAPVVELGRIASNATATNDDGARAITSSLSADLLLETDLGDSLLAGRIKSSKSACKAKRNVFLELQTGAGWFAIGRDKTGPSGVWGMEIIPMDFEFRIRATKRVLPSGTVCPAIAYLPV